MAVVSNRTMFIEKKRKADGTKRFRVLPFYLVNTKLGVCFELAPYTELQRNKSDVGGIEDRNEEANAITHIEFITDERQITEGGPNTLHKYDIHVRDAHGAILAGLSE